MKSPLKTTVVRPAAAAVLSIVISVMAAAKAEADLMAETTLSFSTVTVGGAVSHTFDALVIAWSTPVMAGLIDETDLTDLTFTLTNGGATVYQDQAITNSTVQSIGGATRSITDLDFNYDVSSFPAGFPGTSVFDNDVNIQQSVAASGRTYNVYDIDLVAMSFTVQPYDDGERISTTNTPYTSTTVAVPEPSAFLFIGAVGLGIVVCKKIRRIQHTRLAISFRPLLIQIHHRLT